MLFVENTACLESENDRYQNSSVKQMSTTYSEYKFFSDLNPGGQKRDLAENIKTKVTKLKVIEKICEIVCGNGYFYKELAGIGYSVTGVDLSQSGIQHARSQKCPNAEFVCESIDGDLARKLKSPFDLILAIEVIEHLYRPADLLLAAHKMLRPGGTLMITTPYHGYLKNMAICLLDKFDSHFDPLWDGGHIKFFSPKTLKVLTRQQGFHHIKFDYWGRLPGLWKSMICIAVKMA